MDKSNARSQDDMQNRKLGIMESNMYLPKRTEKQTLCETINEENAQKNNNHSQTPVNPHADKTNPSRKAEKQPLDPKPPPPNIP